MTSSRLLMKPTALGLGILAAALSVLAGCSSIQRDPPIQIWWDMKRQPKFLTEGETGLFSDGRNTRRPVADTQAQGYLEEDTAYYTGMDGAMYVGKSPVPVTEQLIDQGQAKFNTYCSPCHDMIGDGHGIVPARAPQWQPANLMDDRIVQLADGDIFNVISNGRRTMPAYKFQVTTADRWAIIAYLRVLQRAGHATVADVPDSDKGQLQ